MENRSVRVGFIGLGVMGLPMAVNLRKAGYPMVVYTRTRARADSILGSGVRWADGPAAVAAESDVVITMLPDSPDVVQVASGPKGIFAAGRPGLTWVDMSTISPLVARSLAAQAAEHQVESLDAPVSGGEIGAIEAKLSIMVGGSPDTFTRVLPLFQVLGSRAVHMGEAGAGQVTKACNQIVVGITIGAVAEALVLGAKAGVDPARIREALLGGFAQSRILEVHGQRMLSGNFKPGFSSRLEIKDLAIVADTARQLRAPAPLTSLVAQLWNSLAAEGGADLDYTALVKVFEKLADVQLKTVPASSNA